VRVPAIPLATEFGQPDRAEWLALVGKVLKGADVEERLVRSTYDGVRIPALSERADGAPVQAARPLPAADPERPWELRSVVDHPDPATAGRLAIRDLEGGAASLLLRIDPTGADGVACARQDDLAAALDGVLLDLAPVALDAGFAGPETANWLAVAAKRAPGAPLAFHMDPISAWAETGTSPGPIESHVISAAQTGARHAPAYPKATLFLASGRVAHEAGGSEAQEIGLMAAAGLAYVKALVRAGLSAAEAFERVVLGLSTDTDYFLGVAKLRAARTVWSKIAGACGVSAAARVEARASRRMLSALDPWVNMLRLTAATFAAGVGGAQAVVLEPFTRPLGRATDFARRQSRNIQLVLMEEANLGRVADPAGGAWAVEALTDQLARAGWVEFRRIEAEGGVVESLASGAFGARVAAVAARRREDVARGRIRLIGTSEFPQFDGEAVETDPVDAAAFARDLDVRLPGPDGTCDPLRPMRLAEPFEALRRRARQAGGPTVFLAAAEHAPGVGLVRNLLAAGGVSAVEGPPEAFAAAPRRVAILCPSDERLAADCATSARALKRDGAAMVLFAGRPGDAEATLRAAGVDDFLFPGCDAPAILSNVLEVADD
jgi:methylmalonyl-CoA mutase